MYAKTGLGFCAGLILCATAGLTVARAEIGWSNWGNGPRFERYFPVDQINRTNVSQLEPIWKFTLPQRGAWQVTPIVVEGVMYIQDLEGNAFALDPETGRQLWKFSSGQRGKMRGVSYWPGNKAHAPRIILSVDDRIYAIDAATGTQAAGFGGDKGHINIRDGFTTDKPPYRLSSPATIYKDLLITGPATAEFGSNGPPGDPRAYDVVTGKLKWRFHIVPRPGEPNFGTWGPEGWQDRSGPGTWGQMSVDEETGLIFIPVAQPSDNYVGIDRPGDNLYASSVVALEAATGKYRWHFQLVHHDLYDYDVASAPALIDLTIKGKRVPAVVEVSKQGLLFILDRRTGKPVFGYDERPVPKSTVPGEKSSPTQPFPRKPAPLAKQGVKRSDITTITPEANRHCTDSWNRLGFRDTEVFTPPTLTGPNLFAPSNVGGLGGVWSGVSIDTRSNTIFVSVTNQVGYNFLVPDDGKVKGPSTSGIVTDQAFTKWLDPHGLPCIQPPWGELVAVNGNTGDIMWRNTLGAAEVYRELGAHTGMINIGGSVATKGGLVFIGATSMGLGQLQYDDPSLRAFDSATGLEVWKGRLPAGMDSAPMSFVGKSGRQYIVVTASARPETDIALIAFALPRPGETPVDINPAPLHPSRLGVAAPPARRNAATRIEDLPAGTGRDDVAKACTACHSLGTVTATPRTAGGWNNTVAEMRGRGAKIDDAAAKRITDYLSAHFGM